MNPYIKMVIVFVIAYGLYLAAFFIFNKKYKAINKDTHTMNTDNISITLNRGVIPTTIAMGVFSAVFTLFYVDPASYFGKEFTFISVIIYILIYLLSFQALRWSVNINHDEFCINRVFFPPSKFKMDDIKSVQILAVDAMITLKSGKMYVIFGKSIGFDIFREKISNAGLIKTDNKKVATS